MMINFLSGYCRKYLWQISSHEPGIRCHTLTSQVQDFASEHQYRSLHLNVCVCSDSCHLAIEKCTVQCYSLYCVNIAAKKDTKLWSYESWVGLTTDHCTTLHLCLSHDSPCTFMVLNMSTLWYEEIGCTKWSIIVHNSTVYACCCI